MNCANHPETAAVAYCQYCGKALCEQCAHKINNIVSCEPCLAARVHANAAGYRYPAAGPIPPGAQPWGGEPWVAFGLGWIPGVGAMYNGQFAKGLAHVVIFALLVDLAHYNGILGIVIAAWVFYQVFDAYQTAIARRNGTPLPNPLGLNDIGTWFSSRTHAPQAGPVRENAPPPPPNPPAEGPPPDAATASGSASASGFVPESGARYDYSYNYSYNTPPIPQVPPVPPNQYDASTFWHKRGKGIPTGAVILIVLGVLFLLGNLGVFSDYWMERGWPIVLIAIGVWLVIRRSQTPPPVPPAGGVR